MIIDDNTIEKVIEIEAPVSRVWQALTDHKQFGQWFRVDLDQPFEVGGVSTGQMTYPGYEHMAWLATVETMEKEKLFTFRWPDYDPESSSDLAVQPRTLVEFHLESIPAGTRVTIRETGFTGLADHRKVAALRGNTEGWDIQAENLKAHVTAA